MVTKLLASLALLGCLAMAGCNTVAGAGEDISRAGGALSRSAK
ncbi:hypothetical protein CR155_17180 [Pollutimonas nitritireducens]|uniref:Entericidin n=1 Tax=Pollutimonas nitritireducens TaxID=2045209 RepID=A0A2N4UBZ8_9BURK|nr:entericidin A/B family lipoprotein [Pollutimonas nitritireducens]PLC52527.1 hypothetical protein CR155_17180 [Pollutimonas nitritireducens]